MNDRFKFRCYWSDGLKEMYYYDTYYMPKLAKGEEKTAHIMQCTGLKDKNGKLIYEGDIVKIFHVSGTMQGKYFFDVVEWNDLRCRFDTKNYGIIEDDDVYEVIGNIYENEELLNGTNP